MEGEMKARKGFSRLARVCLFLMLLLSLGTAYPSDFYSDANILHCFTGGLSDGSSPPGSLAQDANSFYGMTPSGGTGSSGVIFKTSKDGSSYKILHSFMDGTAADDGATPNGNLILSGAVLYGMTSAGGITGNGTIFKINTDGSKYTILYTFGAGTTANDGVNPNGSLILSGATLYGMTQSGGKIGPQNSGTVGQGTIFKINTNGSGYAILHSFNDGSAANDGYSPMGSLVLYGSTLYGMTQSGGISDEYGNTFGTVFKINTSGTGYAVLHFFNDGSVMNDGQCPLGSLTLSGSTLYGMTKYGGSGGRGTVFKIGTGGKNCALLHSFNDGSVPSDGQCPLGSLVLSGAALYGMTNSGGTSGSGTIFRIDTAGTGCLLLHSFNDGTLPYDGNSPEGDLIVSGTTLYGMTPGGGLYGLGTLLSFPIGKVPGAPTGATAAAGDSQATVAFTPPILDGGSPIISYTVTSKPGGVTQSGTASPITVTGLTDGTSYTFTVTATNAAGTGPASAASNSVTPTSTSAAPGPPTGVSATVAGSGSANVSFTPPLSNGGSSINSYTATSNPGGITQTGASPITVTGLTNGIAYTFTVTATNNAGLTGAPSSPSNSVTPTAVPDAPTGVSATAGNGQASVSFSMWGSNGGSLITAYTATSSPEGISQSWGSSPITVTGLTNGTAYTFTVTATNETGTGPASSPSNSVTPMTAPGAPTGVGAVAAEGSAIVSFTPPAFSGGSPVTSYTVTSSAGDTQSGTASPINVGGLTNGTAYTFTVAATNAAGTGPASAPSNSVTPGSAPSGLLHNFWGGPGDGSNPQGSVVQDAGGLYGMTPTGGSADRGVIFKTSADGSKYKILHSFADGTTANDGYNPYGSLVLSGAALYGMTYSGGASGLGTIFKINTDGSGYAILYSFGQIGGDGDDGSNPYGCLLLSGSTLYGMTSSGGSAAAGTIFKINTNGTGYAVLHSFNDGSALNDGCNPYGSLVLGGTTLYGMTQQNVSGGVVSSNGTIFKIGTSGTGYTVLHSFNDGSVKHDGYSPYGSLVLSGSTLYGTTYYGGQSPSANGTVFKINTSGTGYAILHSFGDETTANDGANPYGSLILSGTTLYGMTFNGGSTGNGTLFEINSSGAGCRILHSFGDGTIPNDGCNPYGDLMLSGSTVYGTTKYGGLFSRGTVFSLPIPTVPGAPTAVSAGDGDSQASVAFSPPASNGGSPITSYTVTSNPGGITQSGTASPITVTGLTDGAAYTFTVTATNMQGTGPESAPSNSVTPSSKQAVPGAPTGASAVAADAQATVSFTPPLSDGNSPITSYTVASSPGGISQSAPSSPITVTGLTNGATYTFKVTAANANGTGLASAPSNSVKPTAVPDAPTGVNATAGDTRAIVSFTPPGSSGGSPINFYTATSNPGGITQNWGSSPITVTGLTNGTAYTFTVTATNDTGISQASLCSNSVTPEGLPGAPTGVGATAGEGMATVYFTPPVSNGGSPITYYTVNSTTGGISAIGADSPIWVPGLTNGTAYAFTVTATNAAGDGPASVPSNSVTTGSVRNGLLHNFSGRPGDGSNPQGSLVQAANELYGTAPSGGAAGAGVIFKTKMDGSGYTILHSFADGTAADDGTSPNGNLVLSGAVLYGMTYSGGIANSGTVFKINLDGSGYAILHSFGDGTTANDGSNPYGSLVLSGSTLYGMTYSGGSGYGTVFKIGTGGSGYAILHSFNDGSVANDGYYPMGSLVMSGAVLYGMTSSGGSGADQGGTIFKIGANGGDYAILHSFNGGSVLYDGYSPMGSLILSGSSLYGTTYHGGRSAGFGTIFKINTDATGYTILRSFGDETVANDGNNPYGSLILSGTTLYGMTVYGGNADGGTVFEINTDGTGCRILYSFNDGTTSSDGYNPYGDLILSGSTVYGMTQNGGIYSQGTVFSLPIPTVPGAPTAVIAGAGDSQATVAFTPPASTGGSQITSYTVTSNPGGISQSGPWTPITVTGLTDGTAYTFTVSATNMRGTGPASAPSNAVKPSSKHVVPGAPTGGSATAGDSEATISFTPPLSNGGSSIISYTVTSNPGGIVQSAPSSPITVAGLTNGTAYTFRVTATNATGTGPASSPSNSVTPKALPDAPTEVSAEAGDSQATVSFTPPDSNGGSTINWFTATSNPGGISQTWGSSPITVSGLNNGTAYTFTVTATNETGAGPASGPSNSVTPMAVPGAPAGVSATAGEECAWVSFTPPAANGGSPITSYTVTWSTNETQNGTASPIYVAGLSNGTAYTFTVTATNATGTGPASAPSNSVTPGSLPDGPLHSFPGITGDGTNPRGSLVQDATYFYGMTQLGGAGSGVIFKTKKDGSNYTILHSFGDGTTAHDGANPYGSMVLSGAVLYGMTSAGGVSGLGTIFKINTDGSGYTILYPFGKIGAKDGANPHGSLVLSGSTLYGMTYGGGIAYSGTVFKIGTNGSGYAILHSFNDGKTVNDGCNPCGSLVLSGTVLHGMTQQDVNGGMVSSNGTIFSIGTNGTGYAVLHRFNDGTVQYDGYSPYGSLVLSGSTLYGMTYYGGRSEGSNGTIFKINTSGAGYAILRSFGDETVANDGANPYGSLALSGTTLYGMTFGGGSASLGTVFEISTSGTLCRILHSFQDGTVPYDGQSPYGDLIVAGSTLYGMTCNGGQNYAGTIFSLAATAAPGAPTGVSATAGDAEATVSFTPPASSGGSAMTSYTVTSNPGGIRQSAPWTPITVTGLTNGTAYTFTVAATNAQGTGPSSSPSNGVTPLGPPGVPTGVTAKAGNGQATVSFAPPDSNGGSAIKSYTVTSNPGGIRKTGTASPITVTGLTNGTAYTFTVTATSALGTGPASVASNSVTPATVAGAPTGVTPKGRNARATVSFTAPAVNPRSAIKSYMATSRPEGAVRGGQARFKHDRARS
jgi:titin